MVPIFPDAPAGRCEEEAEKVREPLLVCFFLWTVHPSVHSECVRVEGH